MSLIHCSFVIMKYNVNYVTSWLISGLEWFWSVSSCLYQQIILFRWSSSSIKIQMNVAVSDTSILKHVVLEQLCFVDVTLWTSLTLDAKQPYWFQNLIVNQHFNGLSGKLLPNSQYFFINFSSNCSHIFIFYMYLPAQFCVQIYQSILR